MSKLNVSVTLHVYEWGIISGHLMSLDNPTCTQIVNQIVRAINAEQGGDEEEDGD